MANNFKIKEIRDFGSIISASFYYVRRYFQSLGRSILYFVVPLILLAGILLSQYFSQNLEIAAGNTSTPINLLLTSGWSVVMAGLAMTVLTAVVFNHMKMAADESIETIRVEDIWTGVKRDFFMILILNIGVFIAIFVGFLFFILPGIFIAVKLTLVPAVYVLEDRDLSNAFSRSWYLITNHWWFTSGLVFVMGLFVSLLSMGISMPFMLISGLSGFAGLENAGTMIGIFYGLVNSLTYILYTVIYLSFGFHYYNLVERKEGVGLEERIGEIDQAQI